jgi:HSP20 family molecular chaperone IbpA
MTWGYADMSKNSELTNTQSKEIKERREENNFVLRPPVNIFEDAKSIVLEADMPGVSNTGLKVEVDKGRLFVEGNAQIDSPQGLEPLYADVRLTRYQFSFALGRELDTGNVDAALKDGVLKLSIPKRPELQPRKVDVRVG